MSKEKQKKECKKCLHYEMCLDNFRKAKEEGLYELTDEEEYFAHADECDFYAAGYRKQSEGEWVKHYRSGVTISEGYVSSCCDMWNNRKSPCCPNCGAKMKGGEE